VIPINFKRDVEAAVSAAKAKTRSAGGTPASTLLGIALKRAAESFALSKSNTK
jgi:hypothetical protein